MGRGGELDIPHGDGHSGEREQRGVRRRGVVAVRVGARPERRAVGAARPTRSRPGGAHRDVEDVEDVARRRESFIERERVSFVVDALVERRRRGL